MNKCTFAVEIDQVIKRVTAGDKQAFAEVVDHFQRPLFGFLGRMGLSQALAEDIAQETFVRAWRSLGQYHAGKAQFSTWLFTIARNLALNELSRAYRQQESVVTEDLPEVACERPQPPEQLAQAQEWQRLHAALRQLPPADRSALALAYIHELGMAEVARIEACTTGAIKTRLHRARQKLRQLLEDDDE